MATATPTASPVGSAADRVELILAQLDQLPTLPAVATRILHATASPDTGTAEIVALIESDQALTSKILSLVRRSNLGVGRKVATVNQAVVLLGLNAVRNAVLSIQIYETFAAHASGTGQGLDRTGFWKHSLAVACAAQLIARRLHPPVGPDEAFVCGLLHDLGKIALDACLPKSYARVVRETEARRACICDIERAVLGVDHTVAGKRLAKRWNLPEAVVDCIWLHHQPPGGLPSAGTSRRMIEVVHLADELVRTLRIGYSGYNRTGDLPALAAAAGLAPQGLEEVQAEIVPALEEHTALFGLGEVTAAALYSQALAEANAELGRLNAAMQQTHHRLEVRSRCFEALCRFHEALSPDDRMPEVCRLVAIGARRALDVRDPVVCLAWAESGGIVHVGTTLNGSDGTAILRTQVAMEELDPSAPGRLQSVPAALGNLVARYARSWGGVPTWWLPLTDGGGGLRRLGGLVVAGSRERIEGFAPYAEELAGLAGAFASALAGAAARTEAESRTEELADVNRRLHAAQEDLLRTRSLGMVAQVAAGAAHELNNPLAVISGRAQMLASSLGAEDEEILGALRIIQQQAERASALVNELSEFAKPKPASPQTISLRPWLEEQRSRWLSRRGLGPEHVVLSIADPGLIVRADPAQLGAVFEALLDNAVEAAGFAAAASSESPPPAGQENVRIQINSASSASDEIVVVSVTDHGPGMTPEVLEHALDPFFSHRPAGRGRGLGLSRAYSLTLSNGGRLWLESTPGAGTTVFVELPAARPG